MIFARLVIGVSVVSIFLVIRSKAARDSGSGFFSSFWMMSKVGSFELMRVDSSANASIRKVVQDIQVSMRPCSWRGADFAVCRYGC